MTSLLIDRETINPCATDDPPSVPKLPLAEYFATEASWYSQHDGPASDLIADAIGRLAKSVRFHDASSVAELLDRDGRLRLCKLDEPIESVDSQTSWLADVIEDERAAYQLPGSGDAAFVVAWTLNQLAWDADFFHAATVEQYETSKKEWELRAEIDHPTAYEPEWN